MPNFVATHKKKIIISVLVTLTIYLTIGIITILSGMRDHLFKADLIVVLGTKVSPEGIPSEGLAARLDKAIAVYQQQYAPLILVSGGIGKEGYDESLAMANYLIAHGIPQQAIIQDNQGNNTRATANNTYHYMIDHHLTSAIIISQYYHIARTKLAFKHRGIKKIGQASPAYTSLRDFYSIPRELLGYPIYYFNLK